MAPRGGWRSRNLRDAAATWAPWRCWRNGLRAGPRRSPLPFTLWPILAFLLATASVVALDYAAFLHISLLDIMGKTPRELLAIHLSEHTGAIIMVLAGLYIIMPFFTFLSLRIANAIRPIIGVDAGALWQTLWRTWVGGAMAIALLAMVIEAVQLHAVANRPRLEPNVYNAGWEPLLTAVISLALLHWWANLAWAARGFLVKHRGGRTLIACQIVGVLLAGRLLLDAVPLGRPLLFWIFDRTAGLLV